MGREIRRVADDFDWPLDKTWEGFLLPKRLEPNPCECEGTGQSKAGRLLSDALLDIMYNHARDAEFDALTEALAGRPRSFIGHDAIDRWNAYEKIVEAAGLDPKKWGICPKCKGHGAVEAYPGQAAEAEAWEPTDPPEGEGWQVWETVSDGSPISPVFPTRDGLIGWLCSPAYSWGVSSPLTREQAERFVGDAWAPSFVFSTADGLRSGDQG